MILETTSWPIRTGWFLGMLLVSSVGFAAQSADEILESARSLIRADRQEVVGTALQLSEGEAKEFWPVYQRYRGEMDRVGDGVKQLVLEYAGLYPDLPAGRSKRMLQEVLKLEKQQVATRAKYLKRFASILPADKALRFAQVESRLDLAVRMELAAVIPLVPVPGEIAGQVSGEVAFVEGTAGGVFVQTLEITAKVTAVDTAKRRVTLMSSEGIKQVVRVGPDAINFDQIRIGDQLEIVVTEQLVVDFGDASSVDASGGLVALAPKGAKPGGVIAEATRMVGTVTTVDAAKRTATLRFEDGASRTLPVRADVNLAAYKPGDRVVFLLTEMVAVRVRKP